MNQAVVDAVTARLNSTTRYYVTLHSPDGTEIGRMNLGDVLPTKVHVKFPRLSSGVINSVQIHSPAFTKDVRLAFETFVAAGNSLHLDLAFP